MEHGSPNCTREDKTSGLPLVESILFAHGLNLKGLARIGPSGWKRIKEVC